MSPPPPPAASSLLSPTIYNADRDTAGFDLRSKLVRPNGTPSARSSSRSSRSYKSVASYFPWPVHPVPSMRGAFEESIKEAMDREDPDKRVRKTLDAASRRLQLLELGDDEFGEEHSSRWRQKPGAKFHPLWKLIAQISFGIHLLHKRTAKSEEEVINILQTHVDDVDGFLEDTNYDFDIAIQDIEERGQLLRMPLENGRVFDKMLRNHDFRTAIIDGNDIIERIIFRTRHAQSRSMDDVSKGLHATAELAKFMERIGRDWTRHDEDMLGVMTAMSGNAEGWYCCFRNIEEKSQHLSQIMAELESTVDEVARRAGIASRRRVRQSHHGLRDGTHSRSKHSRSTSGAKPVSTPISRNSLNKPLPPDPLRPIAIADSRPLQERRKQEIYLTPETPSLESPYPPPLATTPQPHLSLDQVVHIPTQKPSPFINTSENFLTPPKSPMSPTAPRHPPDSFNHTRIPSKQESCPALTRTQSSRSVVFNSHRPSPAESQGSWLDNPTPAPSQRPSREHMEQDVARDSIVPDLPAMPGSFNHVIQTERRASDTAKPAPPEISALDGQHAESNAVKSSARASKLGWPGSDPQPHHSSGSLNAMAVESGRSISSLTSRGHESTEVQRSPVTSHEPHSQVPPEDIIQPIAPPEPKHAQILPSPKNQTPSSPLAMPPKHSPPPPNQPSADIAQGGASSDVTALPKIIESNSPQQTRKSQHGLKKPSITALRSILGKKS